MDEYKISTKAKHWLLVVEAKNYGRAADAACRELNRRPDGTIPGGLHALRTTGDHGKSGWFQGYVPGYGADSNSTGPAFHVM